jgi:hypothetical protein
MPRPFIKLPIKIQAGRVTKNIYIPILCSVKCEEMIDRLLAHAIALGYAIFDSVEMRSQVFICPF